MIKTYKEEDGLWQVYNSKTGKVAYIVKGEDYFMGEVSYFYRVDVNGETKSTLIDNFQTAKKIAYSLVK